jgi:hypothetical protein
LDFRQLAFKDIPTTADHYRDKGRQVAADLGGLRKTAHGVALNQMEADTGSESGDIPTN